MSEHVNLATEDEGAKAPDGHDKSMAEKYDQAQNLDDAGQQSDSAPQKPEGIPDKFWNAETGEVDYAGMAKSYNELESKLGQQGNEKANDEAGETADSNDDAGDENDDTGDIDVEKYTREYLVEGELSEESMQELEEAGFDRDMVEQYLDGQKAIAQLRESAAYEVTGGEDKFQAMQEWARENYSEDEITTFDNAVVGTQEEMIAAIQEMKSKYIAANGSEPNLVDGQNGVTGNQGYESLAQMKADMKDPRYKTDPAYRRQVEQKIARSPNL